MSRLWAMLLAFSVAVGLLAGCSGSGGSGGSGDGSDRSEKLSAAEVGEHIAQAADLGEMKQRDLEKLASLYRIEAEKVDDFVLFTASSNVKADELAIIKMKDANGVDDMLARIEQRIKAQTAKFQDYRPEEYYLIEKHVLKTNGRFILFAVSEQAARMGEAFDEILKG